MGPLRFKTQENLNKTLQNFVFEVFFFIIRLRQSIQPIFDYKDR